ncbi:MAG: BsuBI/PstI family type II restriction endonuclease [Chloroflexota bacterium]
MTDRPNVQAALAVLSALGLPRAQQNARSALCLLALLDLTPDKSWAEAAKPLLGITPVMDWARLHYQAEYAPNTRETFRRQTMHQFMQAGIVLQNPDQPDRAVNSPKTVCQIEPSFLALIRLYGTDLWEQRLREHLADRATLVERYASQRERTLVPVRIARGKSILLSSGAHSTLIRAVIEEFASRFVPGARLLYVGDTGDKWAYFDEARLLALGIAVASHGKMPDVVMHYRRRNWLVLAEAVTSHGPVDPKRHEELAQIFSPSLARPIYVTAFPDRATMARYLPEIAWETEVWVADAPDHLVHFDGSRFLGPYPGRS